MNTDYKEAAKSELLKTGKQLRVLLGGVAGAAVSSIAATSVAQALNTGQVVSNLGAVGFGSSAAASHFAAYSQISAIIALVTNPLTLPIATAVGAAVGIFAGFNIAKKLFD